MKVNSSQIQGPTPEEIKAKIQDKFGVEVGKKKESSQDKETDPDVVVSIDKKGNKKVEENGFGDVKANEPDSEVTQEKLKSILKSGGFHFNAKERSALTQILGK